MDCIKGKTSRPGPEAEMVQDFIQTNLPTTAHKESRCIFIEPYVETSRPDIVVVYWDPSIAADWPEERRALGKLELRLAHLLFISGPLWEEEIQEIFPWRCERLLDRLERSGLAAHNNNGQWELRNFADVFAVRRLITFEAKISSLATALQQAHLNTWFASESYVLTASTRPREYTVERAREIGVGLLVRSDEKSIVSLVAPETQELPRSYASWFFNELAWKTSIGVV